VVGFGVHDGPGKAIHAGTMAPGMENAKNVWVPSIATSGLLVYTGAKFPQWSGSVFVGGLAGMRLVRLTRDGQKAKVADNLIRRNKRAAGEPRTAFISASVAAALTPAADPSPSAPTRPSTGRTSPPRAAPPDA
jgi:glucose/arabinose dehydrogenase